jgi:hypothetical protein
MKENPPKEPEKELCDICGKPTYRLKGEKRITRVNGSDYNMYYSICFDCYLPEGYG